MADGIPFLDRDVLGYAYDRGHRSADAHPTG